MFGTLSTLDDLSNVQTTVADFGEADLARRFEIALAIHNRAFEEAVRDFVMFTDREQLPYGGADEMVWQDLDQFGTADTQKAAGAGANGFPLRIGGLAVQWTRTYLATHGVAKLAKQLDAAAGADIRNLHRQIRRALFSPTNTAYRDVNQTDLPLTLRALLNGDGAAIPIGPNAESFNGSTHTHYLGSATFTEAALASLVTTIIEHGVSGSMRIYINRVQEAALRLFPLFTPYVDARIRPGSAETVAVGDLGFDPSNRAIGLFEGAEVWVKPWIVPNYLEAHDTGAGDDKALALRTRSGSLSGFGAFSIIGEHEHLPLRAQHLGREFGVSAYQRHKAAVLRVDNATYAAPAGL